MAQERETWIKKKKKPRTGKQMAHEECKLKSWSYPPKDNEGERLTYIHVVISPTTPLTTLRGKTEIPLTVTPSYGSYTLFGSPT